MRQTIRRSLGIALLALAASSTLLAQSAPLEWGKVFAVAPGAKVEVVHGNLQRAVGAFVEATDDSVTVSSASGTSTIARADVRRFTIQNKSRKKRTLMGLAIGAAAGAAALAIGANSGDIDIRRDWVVAAGALTGGGLGAAAGAFSGGPETIYRAPQGAKP